MAEWIFILSLALPLWAFLGYPLMVAVLARLSKAPTTGQARAYRVSIIIAAHNEARHIAQKLQSLLEQTYQAESLEILLASDGSTDNTLEEAASINDPRIQRLDLPRQGKQATLNAAFAQSTGDILVFTDADNRWLPETLEHLLAPLNDHDVGVVGGNMQIDKTGDHLSQGDSTYRRFESWLRNAESRCGCMVATDGALMAMRRELFTSVPGDCNDDFHLSTCAPAAGKRIAYAERAIVLDQGVDDTGKQFRRRIRVTLGGLHSLTRRASLLNPLRHGRYALALLSHKLLRRLAPLFLLPLLLSTAALASTSAWMNTLLWLQLAGYGTGLVALLLGLRWRLPKPLRLASFLLVSLAGMALAVCYYLTGQRLGAWNPQQNR
ncbi:glycosyltransferase family 2 protein [Pokkaliibacter sp. CJK22405]|uniref:glycosyltransferase family 2 protein n=1 Tax=Pokkaliibacter sp. CJK22405 TaxID=3384615 RepID=UPI0039846FE0